MRRGRPRTCECGECRKCKMRAYSKAYREKNGSQYKITAEGKRRRNERRMKRYYADRRQSLAHDKVRKAILRGALVRGECEIGGECAGPIEAHHDDYDQPLDVRWVCMKHHYETGHREQPREALGA